MKDEKRFSSQKIRKKNKKMQKKKIIIMISIFFFWEFLQFVDDEETREHRSRVEH